MAQRRMLSKKITDTDLFLDMPLSTQALYFHMNMHADDDGFVGNPKKIMRSIGCSEDDFKLLIAKQFVIRFETGVCVIRHWKIHNYIATDRYNKTIFNDEKGGITTDDNKVYQECNTNRIQDVVHSVDTGKVRLGKVSKGKEEKKKPVKHKYGEFNHVLLTDKEYEELPSKVDDREKWIRKCDEYCERTGKTYQNYSLTMQGWYRDEVKEKGSGNRQQTDAEIDAEVAAQMRANGEEPYDWRRDL